MSRGRCGLYINGVENQTEFGRRQRNICVEPNREDFVSDSCIFLSGLLAGAYSRECQKAPLRAFRWYTDVGAEVIACIMSPSIRLASALFR